MSRQPLRNLISASLRKTIGIMSGTSADGVDLAYCEVNTGAKSLLNLKSMSIAYPALLKEVILDTAQGGTIQLNALIALSTTLGHFYADCVETFCKEHTISSSEIDLVGLHGQTIAHLSEPLTFIGVPRRGTLQIGESEIIAKRIGVVTVSDFRSGDIAVGGSGAPLVPIYHQLRFAKPGVLCAVVNIGGIANVTLLDGESGCSASDTGPGNCLIDTYVQNNMHSQYDADGKIALSGRLNLELLNQLQVDPEMARPLPRSFDRKDLIDMLARHLNSFSRAGITDSDLVATLSELTSRSIAKGIASLAKGRTPESVLICGGGVHNQYIMSRLQEELKPARLSSTSETGSNPDFVEAEAFAYLANLTLDALPGNLPEVTGASRASVLGKISQP